MSFTGKIQWVAAAVLLLAGALFIRAQKAAGPGGSPNTAKPITTMTNTDSSAFSSSTNRETAILAGGCFWGMQEIIRKIPGVIQSRVGYSGGTLDNPGYDAVCTGLTGHAEAVEIVFDPAKITYEAVLGYFFRMHDPTTLNQQHNDVGTQYRSAIFYTSDAQRETALKVKTAVDKSGKWKRPIVTEITKAGAFWPAEKNHQDYLQKNPFGYNCHVLRD